MSNDSSNETDLTEQKPLKAKGIAWRPLDAVIVLVLAFIIAQLLGEFLVSLYPQLMHWTASRGNSWLDNSITAQFFYVLISEVCLVGGIYAYVRRRKGSLAELGVRRPKWIDAAFALLGVLVYLAAYLAAVTLISIFAHLNTSQQQDLGFTNPTGVQAMTLTFVCLVLLPPFAEEFAFRGFLFGTLRKRFSFVVSALATSVLFAFPHLLEGGSGGLLWIAGVDTFVLSMVLCYLRQKTGRLWSGIAVHMLKNSLAFVTLYVAHVH